jgi:hypothetical protein
VHYPSAVINPDTGQLISEAQVTEAKHSVYRHPFPPQSRQLHRRQRTTASRTDSFGHDMPRCFALPVLLQRPAFVPRRPAIG